MNRRSLLGLLVLALVWTTGLHAQMKDTKAMAPKPVIIDINSAPEADLVAVGVDKAVAKKIIEGRPYRNKRELVSRQLLTMELYDKLKDQLIARQPPKK